MMKKLLVVDDEKEIRKMLKEYFEMEGYLVYTAGDGEEALKQVNRELDLILLDVNMPGIDGYHLCERIRGCISCPIIFLTARTEEADRVRGFQAGGDDYVLKPFSMDELLARADAHLRREDRKTQFKKQYLDMELTVDFSGRKVLYKKEDIELTKTEFAILELLITHSGQVFEKEQIYEKVRGFDGEADAAIITEHVRRIRNKLQLKTSKKYIETVWGVGYKWIG